MRRRFAVMMILFAVGLMLSIVGPLSAQATPPIPPNPNAQGIPTTAPASATVANGRVLLNGSVILNPATEAPLCPDVFRINYAPNSQWFVVLLKCAQVGNEAFLFRVDGSQKRHLTGPNDFVVADRLLWSPDSRWLVYERDNELIGPPENGEPDTGIVRYDVQTGDKLLLLARVSFNAATWSPDSRYLGFTVTVYPDNVTHVYLLRADGSGLWELQSVAVYDIDAVLSWEVDSASQSMLTYFSPKVSTEVDYQVSEQPAAALGQGWQTVAPLSPYYVTGVAGNDVLNMRAGPGVNNSIVYKLVPYGSHIFLTGQARDVGPSHWVEVTFVGSKGWVNRKFLLPQLPADAAQPISVRTIASG